MRVSQDTIVPERFKFFNASQKGARLVTCVELVVVAMLSVWVTLSSGVRAGQILLQALSAFMPLWRAHGVVILFLLAVLLAQLVACLTLWGLFAWACAVIVRSSWRQRHRSQSAESQQGVAWQRQRPYVDTDKVLVLQHLQAEEPALVAAGALASADPAAASATHAFPTSQPTSQPQQEASIWSFETGPLHVPLPQTRSAAPLSPLAYGPSSPLHMLVGLASDPGIRHRIRANEDNLIALQSTRTLPSRLLSFGLFAVADGIGGGTNGQEASNIALQAMVESVFPRLMSGNMLDEQVLLEVLTRGVNQANRVLYQRNLKDASRLGTTMTAALVVESQAYVVNVGDSRTYHYRANQGLKQVTSDHSIVARLVDAGIISPEDMYSHPDRGRIYRSLGKEARIETDTFRLQLHRGDSLLLCSDGLWEMVRDPKIEQLLADNPASSMQVSSALLNAALEGGGEDNVSVIVARLV